MQELGSRAIKAGAWTLLFRVVARMLGFARNIVLARVLAPDDIGLFGIVLVVLSFVERFSETGFHTALVQKKDDVSSYLSTVWVALVLRRVTVGLLVVLTAPQLAMLLGDTRAAPLLQLLGVAIFVHAFTNIGTVYFQRELDAKRQFTESLCATSVDLIVSLTLAILFKSAWALLWGLVASRITSVILSYVLHPFRPRLELHWDKLRELSRFGRWVYGNNVVSFLAYRGDKLLIGKLLGASTLGLYMLAYTIAEVVTVEISRIINNVAFPAYARRQSDPQVVRAAFLRSTELVASLAIPSALLTALLAGPLVELLLGQRWAGVATVVPVLAMAGAVRAVTDNGTAVARAIGYPAHGFHRSLLQAVFLLGSLPFLVRPFGIVGAGLAVLIGTLATIPGFARVMHHKLDIPYMDLARTLLPAVLLSVTVAAAVAAGSALSTGSAVAALGSCVLLALLGCVAMCAVLWTRFGLGPAGLVVQLVAGRR